MIDIFNAGKKVHTIKLGDPD